MSTAIHDFFTSELMLFRSNYIIIAISDNAKPLSSFQCNNIRPPTPLKRLSRSAPLLGSNKKDSRWGETPWLRNYQWDCAPGHARRHTTVSRPAVAVSAASSADSSSNKLPPLFPASMCSFSLCSSTQRGDSSPSTIVVKKRPTLEFRADQAISTGTFHLHPQKVSAASQTAPASPRMMYRRHQSGSTPLLLLRAPSDESWRSKKPPKYLCDKPPQAENIIKMVKQLAHRAVMEIKKGGKEPPQKPQRRISLPSKAAAA